MKTSTAWAFYDFANSAYALLITGVGYQIYFKKVITPDSSRYSDLFWAIAVAGSIIAAAVCSPLIGTAADALGLRKQLFTWTTLGAVLFTCSLGFVGPYQLGLGVVLFFLANFVYSLALFLYDSFLKFVSTEENAGAVSGFGWGLGYVGGIVCLALTFKLFVQEPSPSRSAPYRWAFVVVGVFYLIFSIPSIRKLPTVVTRRALNIDGLVRNTFYETFHVLRNWRDYREAFKFLIAYYFLSEAIMTAIYFTANYLSTTFQMPSKNILLFTVLVQLIAFPATWAAGRWGDKWGIKKALVGSALVWIVIVVTIATGRTVFSLYVVSGLMGLVIGSTQALARTMLTNLSPEEKVSALFGFNSLSSKVAATIGPLIFGLASSVTGNQRMGWLSLIPFLLVGAILTLTVKERVPQRQYPVSHSAAL